MRQASLPGCLQVGGLRDTVQQFSPYDNTGTGWTFEWADGGNFRCAAHHLQGYQWSCPTAVANLHAGRCTLMARQLQLIAAEMRLSACPLRSDSIVTTVLVTCAGHRKLTMSDPSCRRDAMGNAIYTYRQFRESFRGVQLRGMQQDLSWDKAAEQYEQVLIDAKYQW